MAPALEQIESVDELRTALNDPAELLEKLHQVVRVSSHFYTALVDRDAFLGHSFGTISEHVGSAG